jgi:hypothetical protein
MIFVEVGPVTIEEVDEALDFARTMLIDRYGNRLNHQTKKLLLESIDDLLDFRLQLQADQDTGGQHGSQEGSFSKTQALPQ